MGAAAAVPAGLSLLGGAYSASMQSAAGRAQGSYYDYLASTSKLNAGLAIAQGENQVHEIAARTAQEQLGLTNRVNSTIGAEKTAMVSGVGASSRTAQDIVSDTLNKGNIDEMALRYNSDTAAKNARLGAQITSMNDTTQAAGYSIAGMNARAMGKEQAIGTLLGTAGSVAQGYYRGSIPGYGRTGIYAGGDGGGSGIGQV